MPVTGSGTQGSGPGLAWGGLLAGAQSPAGTPCCPLPIPKGLFIAEQVEAWPSRGQECPEERAQRRWFGEVGVEGKGLGVIKKGTGWQR